MLPYNIICVGLSAVSTFYLFYGAWLGDHMYSYKENDAVIYGMAMYTISKNVELLDTVFMILRHKYRQVSFLHVSIVRWLFILMFEIVVRMHRFFTHPRVSKSESWIAWKRFERDNFGDLRMIKNNKGSIAQNFVHYT